MDAELAPSYDNLLMGMTEERLSSNYDKTTFLVRSIDDIFFFVLHFAVTPDYYEKLCRDIRWC